MAHRSDADFSSEVSHHSAAQPICRATGFAAIASLLAILACTPTSLAQEAGLRSNGPNAPSVAAVDASRTGPGKTLRLVAREFAVVDVMARGCALAGGREKECWSAIGTPLTKKAVADATLSRILRGAGVPADVTRDGSWQRLETSFRALEIAQTDFVVPAGAVSLPVYRVLVGSGSGLLGARWRLNWENRIARGGAGYVVSEAARQIEFVANGTEFVGPPGERLFIDGNTGALVRERGDLTRDGYDLQGRLAWRDFGNGNRATLHYDSAGRLSRIEGPFGAWLAFTLDDAGRLTRIDTSTGEAVTYTYSNSDLVSVETPSEAPVRYVYQAEHLVRIDDPKHGAVALTYDETGRITRRQRADGSAEVWQYDDALHAVTRTDPSGAEAVLASAPDRSRFTRFDPDGRSIVVDYDGNGRPIAVTNAGRTAQLGHDALGRLDSVQVSGRLIQLGYLGTTTLLTAINGAGGEEYAFAYNNAGDLIRATVDGLSVGVLTYDGRGQLAAQTVRGAPARQFEYDNAGRLTAIVDALGQRTRFEYDSRGRLTRKTDPTDVSVAYAYDDKNRLASETTVLGTTRFTYDAAGRLIGRIERDGTSQSYQLDAMGRRIAVIDAAGRRSDMKIVAQGTTEQRFMDGSTLRRRFDSSGRLLDTSDSRGRTMRYQYDAAGRLVATHDGLGRSSIWRYDAAGRLTASDDGLGGVRRYRWTNGVVSAVTDAAGATTRFRFDNNGRLGMVIDPAGGARRLAYDPSGRTAAVSTPSGDLLRFEYNAEGGLLAVRRPSGATTRYARDAAGRVVSVTHPDGATVRHVYDKAGNQTSLLDAEGRKLEFAFDPVGRLAGKKLPDGTAVDYRYSPFGTLIEADDKHFPVRRTLDDKGNVTSITWPAISKSISLAYDALGREAQLTGSGGQQVKYRYDATSRLTALVLPDGKQIEIDYDVGGRLKQVRFPNGVRGDYRYGPTGTVQSLAWTDASGSTLASWAHRYDSRGNVIAIDRAGAPQLQYAYDADGRLVEERADARATRYAYRPGGDRTASSEGGGSTPYTYNDDRLVAVGTDRLNYDPTGNLIQHSGPAGVTQYRYDTEGRLAGATTSQGAQITFTYDAAGDRVARKDDQGTTYFLQHKQQMVEELDAKGNAHAFYVYGPGIDHPLAMLRDGKVYFYLADALGSVALLTDATGKVAAHYETDAFGRLLSPLPALANPFIFAGREYEPALGLYFNRARYYDPALGRFLSPDPFAGTPRRPSSFNRYAYASNAPTRYRDPLGLADTENLGSPGAPGAPKGSTGNQPAQPAGPPAAPDAGAVNRTPTLVPGQPAGAGAANRSPTYIGPAPAQPASSPAAGAAPEQPSLPAAPAGGGPATNNQIPPIYDVNSPPDQLFVLKRIDPTRPGIDYERWNVDPAIIRQWVAVVKARIIDNRTYFSPDGIPYQQYGGNRPSMSDAQLEADANYIVEKILIEKMSQGQASELIDDPEGGLLERWSSKVDVDIASVEQAVQDGYLFLPGVIEHNPNYDPAQDEIVAGIARMDDENYANKLGDYAPDAPSNQPSAGVNSGNGPQTVDPNAVTVDAKTGLRYDPNAVTVDGSTGLKVDPNSVTVDGKTGLRYDPNAPTVEIPGGTPPGTPPNQPPAPSGAAADSGATPPGTPSSEPLPKLPLGSELPPIEGPKYGNPQLGLDPPKPSAAQNIGEATTLGAYTTFATCMAAGNKQIDCLKQSAISGTLGATCAALQEASGTPVGAAGLVCGAALGYLACLNAKRAGDDPNKCTDESRQALTPTLFCATVGVLNPAVGAICSSVAPSAWEAFNALKAEENSEEGERNNMAGAAVGVGNLVKDCNYTQALDLLKIDYMARVQAQGDVPRWVVRLYGRLKVLVNTQEQIDKIVQDAYASNDPAQTQELLNKALIVAGDVACLRARVPSLGPTPPKIASSTGGGSSPPPKPPTTPKSPTTAACKAPSITTAANATPPCACSSYLMCNYSDGSQDPMVTDLSTIAPEVAMVDTGSAPQFPGYPVTKNYCVRWLCNNASSGTTSSFDGDMNHVSATSTCSSGFVKAQYVGVGCDTGMVNNAGQNAALAKAAQAAFLACSAPKTAGAKTGPSCTQQCNFSDGSSMPASVAGDPSYAAWYIQEGYVQPAGANPTSYCLPKVCVYPLTGEHYSLIGLTQCHAGDSLVSLTGISCSSSTSSGCTAPATAATTAPPPSPPVSSPAPATAAATTSPPSSPASSPAPATAAATTPQPSSPISALEPPYSPPIPPLVPQPSMPAPSIGSGSSPAVSSSNAGASPAPDSAVNSGASVVPSLATPPPLPFIPSVTPAVAVPTVVLRPALSNTNAGTSPAPSLTAPAPGQPAAGVASGECHFSADGTQQICTQNGKVIGTAPVSTPAATTPSPSLVPAIVPAIANAAPSVVLRQNNLAPSGGSAGTNSVGSWPAGSMTTPGATTLSPTSTNSGIALQPNSRLGTSSGTPTTPGSATPAASSPVTQSVGYGSCNAQGVCTSTSRPLNTATTTSSPSTSSPSTSSSSTSSKSTSSSSNTTSATTTKSTALTTSTTSSSSSSQKTTTSGSQKTKGILPPRRVNSYNPRRPWTGGQQVANSSHSSFGSGRSSGFRGKGFGQGIGGGRWHFSDIRLKQDIVPLGRLDNGIGVYRFRYSGTDHAVYVGVMAQEVQAIVPNAVSRGRDGYLRVDYDRLGLRFLTWDAWITRGSTPSQNAQ